MTESFPEKLAQYDVLRRLGAGGMAEVFLARKSGAEGTSKIVVVKRILPSFGASRRFRTMFIDEAQLATRLNHPNVVQVYDFSNEGAEGHILAMEYVEGPDFGMIVAAARAAGVRLPPWVSAYVIAEVAKGLHYAHEKKDDGGASLEIVHRDVSPQNVLLSYDGSVKIADFGIASARFLQDEQGVIKGKYGYMSPEQARGERVDRRSDLYSLGVILWECLSGRSRRQRHRDGAPRGGPHGPRRAAEHVRDGSARRARADRDEAPRAAARGPLRDGEGARGGHRSSAPVAPRAGGRRGPWRRRSTRSSRGRAIVAAIAAGPPRLGPSSRTPRRRWRSRAIARPRRRGPTSAAASTARCGTSRS
ncbi:MAG: serine/threonine protein kinase [Myxococcales bacterium]|nr:serine/threonine protein kinase [Myxococcales bacterium]